METATWVLASATVALVFATGGLLYSASQYTKATKDMARSTRKYTEISEKLLWAEKVSFLARMSELATHPLHLDKDLADKLSNACQGIIIQLLEELNKGRSPNTSK